MFSAAIFLILGFLGHAMNAPGSTGELGQGDAAPESFANSENVAVSEFGLAARREDEGPPRGVTPSVGIAAAGLCDDGFISDEDSFLGTFPSVLQPHGQYPPPSIGERIENGEGGAEDWDEPMLPQAGTGISYTFIPRIGDDGFGIHSFAFHHTLWLGYGELEPLSIVPGFGMHQWSGPAAVDLPGQVYDLYLDLQWMPWQSGSNTLLLGATPGLFGDFDQLDRHSFQWSGWLVGTHQLEADWKLIGGVAYLRQLESNWLPIGGVIWTPNERTRFELIFPQPKLARKLGTGGDWTRWGYVAGQFGGGAWGVADTPQQNVLIGYSDWRLLVGLEAFSTCGYQGQLEVGYVFNRDLSVNDYWIESPADSLILQASLVF